MMDAGEGRGRQQEGSNKAAGRQRPRLHPHTVISHLRECCRLYGSDERGARGVVALPRPVVLKYPRVDQEGLWGVYGQRDGPRAGGEGALEHRVRRPRDLPVWVVLSEQPDLDQRIRPERLLVEHPLEEWRRSLSVLLVQDSVTRLHHRLQLCEACPILRRPRRLASPCQQYVCK